MQQFELFQRKLRRMSKQSRTGQTGFHIDLNADSSIKHVIGVVSGKGGVGKSMVTASLANQKAKEGYKVGILDADITGPSIPKMYGLKGPANVDDKGVYPAVAANGVKVMSINLLLPGEEEPVIWRGPVIAGTVNSSGPTSSGATWTISSSICRQEPVMFR